MSDQPEITGFGIKERIGKGGMASVYLACDPSGVTVAIKAIDSRVRGGEEMCAEFARESAIIGKLRHSSIIRIYRYGQDGPWHYLVTEHLPGGDLKARIRKGMDIDAAVDVLRRLVGALDVAHEAGLVHQDVKPENVLYRSTGTPVLMDFGIASQAGAANADMRGTPLYMSPEQVQSKMIDRRTDIYSLGCVLYEMLTGSPPYPLDSMQAILYAQVHKPVPRLPAELQGIQTLLDRMMCKDVNERIGSAKELLEALDTVWLFAPESTGDHTKTSRKAFGEAALDGSSGTAESTAVCEAPAPIDSWQASYDLAIGYLTEGDMVSGISLMQTIAERAQGEMALLAQEMLYRLRH